MIATFLRKYWLILISTPFISTGIILACTGDQGAEYGTSNFTPEVFVDNAYSPFFYSSQSYYGIGHDESHNSRFNTSNVTEWAGYLGKKIPEKELELLLDSTSSATIDSAAAWFGGRSAAPPASLQTFHILDNKNDKKSAAFFRYLRLGKQCEAFSVNRIYYSWERDDKKDTPVHFNAINLDKQLKEGLAGAADPFLQQRYWFQWVRSCFYNNKPQQAIALFGEYDRKFPKNTIYYRTLAFTAGAYYRLKNFTKANYYYSRVFDSCNELKIVAHYSFHPQEENDWHATLALCRNKEEKATLWQMLGIFYSDPQRAIREIYSLDPGSEKLELLLSRAINESEQRSNNDYGFVVDMPHRPDDSSSAPLRELVTRIARAGNTSKPRVWQLAAGYLNMLDDRFSIADSYYSKAEKIIPKEKLPREQLRLLKMLNRIASVKTLTPKIEEELRPDIQWLIAIQKDPAIRNYDAFVWLKRVMAARYSKAGDPVKSECFLSQPAFYTDNNNVEALKAFFNKSGKTPYEEFCAAFSDVKKEDLFEYQAIQLCMDDRIDEALKAMSQVSTSPKYILPGNPFNGRIVDCHDCDHAATQKIKYSKQSFLQKLKEIKDKIAAGQDVCTNALLLGNAQYNVTHYGNARAFTECKVIGSDYTEPSSIDTVFQIPLLYSMKTAIKYYTLALNAATTDEQKAKCQYMLAKCEYNEWDNHITNNGIDNRTGPDFLEWQGFKALRQYPNTQYYKEVLKECGYFKTYISKRTQH